MLREEENNINETSSEENESNGETEVTPTQKPPSKTRSLRMPCPAPVIEKQLNSSSKAGARKDENKLPALTKGKTSKLNSADHRPVESERAIRQKSVHGIPASKFSS